MIAGKKPSKTKTNMPPGSRYKQVNGGEVVRRFVTCASCAGEVEAAGMKKCPHCGSALPVVRLGIEYEDGSIKSADERVRKRSVTP